MTAAASEIVALLADTNPVVTGVDWPAVCALCAAEDPFVPSMHAPDCPWLLAKRRVESGRTPDDVRVLSDDAITPWFRYMVGVESMLNDCTVLVLTVDSTDLADHASDIGSTPLETAETFGDTLRSRFDPWPAAERPVFVIMDEAGTVLDHNLGRAELGRRFDP